MAPGRLDFDITKVDSDIIDMGAPQKLGQAFLALLKNNTPNLKRLETINIEEERLRICTNIAVAAGLLGESSEQEGLQRLEDMILQRGEYIESDIYEVNGVRYLSAPESMVLLLPYLGSVSQTYSTIATLDDLVRTDADGRTWILDCGAFGNFASNLIAYLMGVKHTLELHDSKLMLLWLKREHVPPDLLPTLVNEFRLVKKGAFLMTKY